MMTKEQYRDWCLTQPNLPLFMQDWWMDAVCLGKEWQVIAGMPCLVRKRMGFKYVLMPQLTQIGGLYLEDSSYQLALDHATDIDHELTNAKLSYYYQHFPLSSPIPDMLRQKGYYVSDRITYRLYSLSDLDAVFEKFSDNKKRQIRKSERNGMELCELSVEEFYAFHKSCMKAQRKRISYSLELLQSIDRACAARDARKILGLRTASGSLCSAAYLVYDKNVCYYLIPCYDPAYHNSGAGSRMVWESIRFAAEHSTIFDFEGSMNPGIANHYSQFGSSPAFYRSVEMMYTPLFTLALMFNDWRNRDTRL